MCFQMLDYPVHPGIAAVEQVHLQLVLRWRPAAIQGLQVQEPHIAINGYGGFLEQWADKPLPHVLPIASDSIVRRDKIVKGFTPALGQKPLRWWYPSVTLNKPFPLVIRDAYLDDLRDMSHDLLSPVYLLSLTVPWSIIILLYGCIFVSLMHNIQNKVFVTKACTALIQIICQMAWPNSVSLRSLLPSFIVATAKTIHSKHSWDPCHRNPTASIISIMATTQKSCNLWQIPGASIKVAKVGALWVFSLHRTSSQ
jgi:hypothetical protein